LAATLLNFFGRVDAKIILEVERDRVGARYVRQQVSGEDT
jgi:hypothetical protein